MKWMALAGLLVLAACEDGFDLDLRDSVGGFDTSGAAQTGTAPRPNPDARGVISYPGYQVVVANRDDTATLIAERLGLDAAPLARFNGITPNTRLRAGEILALPTRVATIPGSNGEVDITELANAAIDAAPEDAARPAAQVETTPLAQGPEPIRHKVARGETAFTIARLYDVPVRSLAEWNALDADLTVREGQFLLIPVRASAAARTDGSTTPPGAGSATPAPPSSTTPVPEEDATPEAQLGAAPPPPPPAPVATPEDTAEFLTPVAGPVIRSYSRGRNDGVDFGADAGAPVRAADAGTVAAITRDTNDVAIIVIRHDGDLLTVYTQVDDLRVKEGDRVRRGARIASVREGDPSFLHFEVRNGLESVDPSIYLDL